MSEPTTTTTPKAISSYGIYLMRKGSSGAYRKVVDIKDFPDLGGAPELLETTTLTDNMQTYTPGIQTLDALTFTANYNTDTYDSIKLVEGEEHDYAIWFGGSIIEDGSGTANTATDEFLFKGTISVYVNGAGVNEVVNMTVTIAPSTPITKA